MDLHSLPIHLGPFTKNNFDPQEWNQFEPVLIPSKKPSDSWQDANYGFLLQLLQQINNSPDYNEYFGDPSIKEYFFEDLFPKAVLKLLDLVPPKESEARETIGKCLEEFINLWCKASNEGSSGLMQILTSLLHPNKGFYSSHYSGFSVQSTTKEGGKYAKTFKNSSVSPFYSDILERFGEAGGFDLILRRICDENPSSPVDFATEACIIIEKAKSFFNQKFYEEYIPKFHESVIEHLLMGKFETSHSDYIQKMRPFFNTLHQIPYIFKTPEAKTDFELKMLTRCLNSPSLPGKMCALHLLGKCISHPHYSIETADKNVNRFLVDKSVFSRLYSENRSPELIKQSKKFFFYMFKLDLLTSQDFELVLDMYTGEANNQIRQELSGILNCAASTKYAQRLLVKVLETPVEEIKEPELNLIKALYSSVSSTQTSKSIWEIYRKLAPTQNPQAPHSLPLATALKNIHFHCLETNPHYKDAIIETLGDKVAKIGGDVPTLQVYQQIYELLKLFRKKVTSSKMFTRGKCITRLCTEKNFLDVVVEEFKSYKKQLQQNENASALTSERQQIVPQDYVDRLEFIMVLISSGGEGVLTYKILNELWSIVVEALNPSARTMGLNFFKAIAAIEDENLAEKVGLMRFFREKLPYENLLAYLESGKEAFKFFKSFFVMTNRNVGSLSKLKPSNDSANKGQDEFSYTLKVLPEEVKGLDTIWRQLIETQDSSILEEITDMLIKLYAYADEEVRGKAISTFERNCATLLENMLKKPEKTSFKDKCLIYFRLIKMTIEVTEKEGFGDLKSHLEFAKGEALTICVSHRPSSMISSRYTRNMDQSDTENLRFKLDSASTVLDLRLQVARASGLLWDVFELSLEKDKKKIEHNENHKTLQSLNLRDNQTIFYERKLRPSMERMVLLQDGALIPKMQEIVVSWFEEYSDNGRMSPGLFFEFSLPERVRGHYLVERVSSVFALANENRDCLLTLEDFTKYHIFLLKEYPHNFWTKLLEKCYREDLKKVNNLGQIHVDSTLLLRYLVSANNKHFQLLYSLLDSVVPEVAAQAWQLISIIPTNPQIFADIVSLKGIQGFTSDSDARWKDLLGSDSDYKLLYSLYIIDGLLQRQKKGDRERFFEKFLWPKNKQLLDSQHSWKANFLAYGGLNYLLQIFIRNLKPQSNATLAHKHASMLVLRIIAYYVPSTCMELISSLDEGQLKKIFKSLTSLAIEFLSESKVAFSNEVGPDQIMEKLASLKKEDFVADLSQILSNVDLKSLVIATLELTDSVSLDVDGLVTEDIIIMKSSTCILAAILLYQKSY